jgi:hypothetical protein
MMRSGGVAPTKTSLRVDQNASALAFALYAFPQHAKPRPRDYPWPIPIARPGDDLRPSELTFELARLAYIHDLAGELSDPARAAIRSEALSSIAESALLAKGQAPATTKRFEPPRKSTVAAS